MRTRSVVSWCVLALAALPARADQEFPYTAYVHSEDVYVRSGPGRNYYPTDKLEKREEVEVYRHDPGGWYAIRPPKDSFSWISSRHVRPTGEGLGVVTEDQVVARVGSKFSNIRDVIQVRLDKDEPVDILEEHNSGGQTWYKIAPPSGEFRWVAGRFVDPKPVHDGVGEPRRPNDDELIVDEDAAYEPEPKAAKPASYSDDTQVAGNSTRRQASKNPRPASGHPTSDESLDAQLESIDLDLTAMVAEEPTVWTFHELNSRTEQLLEKATTALERGRVRRISHKIARFEDIRARYDTIEGVVAETDHRNRQLGQAMDVDRRQTGESSKISIAEPGADEQDFDAQGVLRPVISRRADAPRYALVDESGTVSSFITPAPGLNLQSYVGQRVGMSGTRGFMPDLKKAHVMAKRVTPLDTTLRR